MLKTSITIFCFVLFCYSCNLAKKTVDGTPEVTVTCDETMSYSGTIKAIFDSRCVKCHSGDRPANGIDLASYETASKVVSARLTCAITWGDNCNNMPPGGSKLSTSEIQEIQCWLDNGVKN